MCARLGSCAAARGSAATPSTFRHCLCSGFATAERASDSGFESPVAYDDGRRRNQRRGRSEARACWGFTTFGNFTGHTSKSTPRWTAWTASPARLAGCRWWSSNCAIGRCQHCQPFYKQGGLYQVQLAHPSLWQSDAFDCAHDVQDHGPQQRHLGLCHVGLDAGRRKARRWADHNGVALLVGLLLSDFTQCAGKTAGKAKAKWQRLHMVSHDFLGTAVDSAHVCASLWLEACQGPAAQGLQTRPRGRL
mmetsp:Transcript_54732/g.108936  ORF Transcript_54732/g.108936 Transcript_54732/m.108936 type:complete len:248 (+) Transcript_54732:2562-3305(+)